MAFAVLGVGMGCALWFCMTIDIKDISVDMTTGKIAYPCPDGFKLDMDKVYSTFERFLPHCHGNAEQALKLAVHGQIAAYNGAAPFRKLLA